MSQTLKDPNPMLAEIISWEEFKAHIVNENRYFMEKMHQNFLKDLLRKARGNQRFFKAKIISFYRARLGAEKLPGLAELKRQLDRRELSQKIWSASYEKVKPYTGKEMGAPPKEFRAAQRCSAPGMPCLYLATDPQTAIAEIRPFLGAFLSVASFQAKKKIKLVDFSDAPGLDGKKAIASFFDTISNIGYDFARPVSREDAAVDYIPTQVLAEFFKKHGFNGIYYKSLVSDSGNNVAIFNEQDFEFKESKIYEVKKVEYAVAECMSGRVSVEEMLNIHWE